MEQLKTDTQETKKKVLGGNTSGNLLNYLILCEQTRRNRSNPTIAFAPTVVKYVGKKFSEFRVVRKWLENTRFSPENAKNKAENGSLSALFGLSDTT